MKKTRAKRKFRKQPTVRKLHYTGLPSTITAFILGVIAVLSTIAFFHLQFTTVTETPKSESKKLPRDIRDGFPGETTRSVKIPILLYHYVETVKNPQDRIRVALNVPPRVFENQISTLKNDGYTFMTVSEIAAAIRNDRPLPPKPVAITIDDGHWDLYTDILPILEKYQAKATAYIISGFIGGPDFLTSDQLSGVINSGIIEIGAHTMHHIELAKKLLPVVEYEVTQSKSTLEHAYNIRVESFAYPNGSFDKQAADAVRRAGFTSAVSTVSGIDQSGDNIYFLYRLRPERRTGKELLWYIQKQNFIVRKHTVASNAE